MLHITATIEYVRPGEAIVTLSDSCGEYGCALVQCRSGNRSDLYAAGYHLADLDATSKGGRLDSFREVASPRVSYVASPEGIFKETDGIMTGPYSPKELGLLDTPIPGCQTLKCRFLEGVSLSFGFGYGNRADNTF